MWQGGLGIWGAVTLGAVGAWIAARRKGLLLPPLADALAPGIVLAQAIGRWGNWFNNELYGGPTTQPWGLQIHQWDTEAGHAVLGPDGKPIVLGTFHPTFLYESLWDLALAGVLILVDRRFKIGHGRLFALYVLLYTIGRGWIEALRVDPANHILGLRLNEWTSVLVGLGALAYIIVSARLHPGRETTVLRHSAAPVQHVSVEERLASGRPARDASADAGTEDAGTEDAGTEDAGTEDAGTEDAGTEDAGTADAGTEDAGTEDRPRTRARTPGPRTPGPRTPGPRTPGRRPRRRLPSAGGGAGVRHPRRRPRGTPATPATTSRRRSPTPRAEHVHAASHDRRAGTTGPASRTSTWGDGPAAATRGAGMAIKVGAGGSLTLRAARKGRDCGAPGGPRAAPGPVYSSGPRAAVTVTTHPRGPSASLRGGPTPAPATHAGSGRRRGGRSPDATRWPHDLALPPVLHEARGRRPLRRRARARCVRRRLRGDHAR